MSVVLYRIAADTKDYPANDMGVSADVELTTGPTSGFLGTTLTVVENGLLPWTEAASANQSFALKGD